MDSTDRILVCTHATFRFAIDRFGVEAFDDCLIAVDDSIMLVATLITSWVRIWGSLWCVTRCILWQ